MTTLHEMGKQPLTLDSLVSIMVRSVEGWNQMATFVTLAIYHKIELVREWQRRLIATMTQHPYQTSPSPYLPLATQQRKKMIHIGQYQHLVANNTTAMDPNRTVYRTNHTNE